MFHSIWISETAGLHGASLAPQNSGSESKNTLNYNACPGVDTPLVQNQLAHLAQEEGISKEEALNKHLLQIGAETIHQRIGDRRLRRLTRL